MPLSRRNFIQNAVLGISAAGLSAAPGPCQKYLIFNGTYHQ